MADCMNFPATVEEFMEQYKVTDYKQIYTNGTELVPIFRMKQWFEHQTTVDVAPVRHGEWIWKPTKQYCSPDCWYPPSSCEETWDEKNGTWLEDEMYCSECDYHNYHEIKYNFCPSCGARMDEEGEK